MMGRERVVHGDRVGSELMQVEEEEEEGSVMREEEMPGIACLYK